MTAPFVQGPYQREKPTATNDRLEKIDRTAWCVDGSVIRAHRVASGMALRSEENNKIQALSNTGVLTLHNFM
ncbi:hypothetical protein [Neorhodopirellula lusitana]|uniref:hypothetical protein n=1 Tax=Neorhodopirellula lusitana TaxID=445327 RepID=UPI00384E2F15